MELSRRAALSALALTSLGAVTACATQAAPAAPSSAPRSTRTPTPSPTPSPTATPTPTPTPTIDPGAVAARFADSVPTAWGLDLPGVRGTLRTQTTGPAVALTFDGCGGRGGSGVDQRLLDILRAEQVPATLFLNARWVEVNPQLAAELAADPLFVIGNHGTRHVPLSVTGRDAYGIPGTASAAEAVDEVWGNQTVLTELVGAPPRFFRPGTAFYDDVGVQIALALGTEPIGFAVNGDGGATFSAATVRREVGSAAPGSIVIAHLNRPGSGTADGIAGAIADLRARGIGFAHVDA